MSKEKAELEKIIDSVDNSFEESVSSIQIIVAIVLLSAAGLLALGVVSAPPVPRNKNSTRFDELSIKTAS